MNRNADRISACVVYVLLACGSCGDAAGSTARADVRHVVDVADDAEVRTDLGRRFEDMTVDAESDAEPDVGADADVVAEIVDRAEAGPVDITDTPFSMRDADCAAYAARYASSVLDVQRRMAFNGSVVITVEDAYCRFETASIPNHDFNDTGRFATPVASVAATYRVPRDPAPGATPTALSLMFDNAIFLNGVKLDELAAACYGVGPEPLGQERIGCMRMGTPWRYDPMGPGAGFGTDSHHAHTQPDGSYHYHAGPRALFDDEQPTEPSPVIGFAADGFPIYGSYFDDGGTIRRARSGYTLRAGDRQSQEGEGSLPGGAYDGTFVDDWEWTGAGDLDECNGMTVDGVYGYYVTDGYPWVIGCFRGTPDESFRKAPPR